LARTTTQVGEGLVANMGRLA